MIVFYGHFSSDSSFPVVCKAIARWAFKKRRKFCICDLRRPAWSPSAELEHELCGIRRVPSDIQQHVIENMRVIQSGNAPKDRLSLDGRALLFAFPEWSWALPIHDGGLVGYHVCDVDAVPSYWVDAISANESFMLTPSSWCSQVFRNCGVPGKISVVRHGIDPDIFSPIERTYTFPAVRYFCSSQTGHRKSLYETMKAWKIAVGKGAGGTLIVRGLKDDLVRQFVNIPNVLFERGAPLTPESMARVLRSTDLLLAPSRAEGFGMIPLQALACGTPVVMTDCTGHSEFVSRLQPSSGVYIVQTGEMSPCPIEAGKAPSLDAYHLADAIVAALKSLDILKQEAFLASTYVRDKWSWNSVLSGSALDRLLSS